MNRKLTFAATAVGVASTLMSGVAFMRRIVWVLLGAIMFLGTEADIDRSRAPP
jgi:hypothetical protein